MKNIITITIDTDEIKSTENKSTSLMLPFAERAMRVLDDYLNASGKEATQIASVKAKALYKEYYGINYANRNERNYILSRFAETN